MKMYKASFETIFLRFNLMMAVAILPFIMGIPILAIAALPIFLSCMFGIQFTFRKPKRTGITVYPDLGIDRMGRNAA